MQAWSLMRVEAVEQASIELRDLSDEHVHVPGGLRARWDAQHFHNMMPGVGCQLCCLLGCSFCSVSYLLRPFSRYSQGFQTCLGHKRAFWPGASAFCKKNIWALGLVQGKGGAPSYSTSAHVLHQDAPIGLVPSTFLLIYFEHSYEALGEGRGVLLARYLCRTPGSVHKRQVFFFLQLLLQSLRTRHIVTQQSLGLSRVCQARFKQKTGSNLGHLLLGSDRIRRVATARDTL